jgi:hypothetical protein
MLGRSHGGGVIVGSALNTRSEKPAFAMNCITWLEKCYMTGWHNWASLSVIGRQLKVFGAGDGKYIMLG